jgi:hypothetical protein
MMPVMMDDAGTESKSEAITIIWETKGKLTHVLKKKERPRSNNKV